MSRHLLTGAHVVADIYCLQCHTQLGWMYDDATNDGQKYKIGKYVMELARIRRRADEIREREQMAVQENQIEEEEEDEEEQLVEDQAEEELV